MNIRLSRGACSERVSFKGKRETGDAADYVPIPSEYFVTPRNFISETGDIGPLLSGANEEEEILAYAMSNEPVAWYHVLVNRDDFLKWFGEEFPQLHSNVAAPESHPDANLDATQMSRTGAAGRPSGMHLVKSELERRANSGEIPIPNNGSIKMIADELAEWYESGPRKKQTKLPPLKSDTIRKALRSEIRAAISASGRN